MVGLTQCGKTFFVEKILTMDRILYESKKPRRIWWYYSQWQNSHKVMQSSIGKEIQFFFCVAFQSLKKIFGKLTQSLTMCWCLMILWPKQQIVVCLLFTQGRHRNASVILLLQNMFPKGNFDTDISRKAQYVALFQSPSDRKQIGIIAERMFDKNRPRFMSAYFQETERAFGSFFVDNRPDTPSDKQVLSDIFCSCRRYPTINSSTKSVETVKTLQGKHFLRS